MLKTQNYWCFLFEYKRKGISFLSQGKFYYSVNFQISTTNIDFIVIMKDFTSWYRYILDCFLPGKLTMVSVLNYMTLCLLLQETEYTQYDFSVVESVP